MGYQDQIVPQEDAVKKLTDEYAVKPTPELKAKLVRETDLLRYLRNAAKGVPKDRAQKAVTRAKRFVLNKIVP
ncbi:MAG TPA: hypothetical protein VK468_01630 [Pyrinomonadaceae bacterium]|nr:hypothetical protein [Pyrinomonadaceae bacterium]